MTIVDINRNAYFVHHRAPEGLRTYACADRTGLDACLSHLSGRAINTFLLDGRGLPIVPGCSIADNCHIYSTREDACDV